MKMIIFGIILSTIIQSANAADEKYKFCAIKGIAQSEGSDFLSSLALTMIFKGLPGGGDSTCWAVDKAAQEYFKKMTSHLSNGKQYSATEDEKIWLSWYTEFKNKVYSSILKDAGYSITNPK